LTMTAGRKGTVGVPWCLSNFTHAASAAAVEAGAGPLSVVHPPHPQRLHTHRQ
jgi:hypothetical protein